MATVQPRAGHPGQEQRAGAAGQHDHRHDRRGGAGAIVDEQPDQLVVIGRAGAGGGGEAVARLAHAAPDVVRRLLVARRGRWSAMRRGEAAALGRADGSVAAARRSSPSRTAVAVVPIIPRQPKALRPY